jgi:hypothetical protein
MGLNILWDMGLDMSSSDGGMEQAAIEGGNQLEALALWTKGTCSDW